MSTTLKSIMKDYFSGDSTRNDRVRPSFLNEIVKSSLDDTLPVSVQGSSWGLMSNPERLQRAFRFSSIQLRNHFVSELMQYEKDFSHHAMICIEGDTVTIEVYTHDINRVTELDKEYADNCDLIFDDLQHWDVN